MLSQSSTKKFDISLIRITQGNKKTGSRQADVGSMLGLNQCARIIK